ncbi:MAG TPA: alpha/beta fold hydrolase [Anaeromyxobacteraceae bacterium]|nr:alpha/beta fold hydrolase [Anaeromyxobacteraceae bacterium]
MVRKDGLELEIPGGPDAVLLLHGLTGSTFELHVVAERLARAGHRCLAPVMAGHGGPPSRLRGVRFEDWIAKAERDLARLDGARRTFVVGCSMGALAACALAGAHPDRVDALVLLSPALELQRAGALGGLLGRLPFAGALVIPKSAGSDVRDAEMRRLNPTMPGVPLGAIAELERMQRHVAALLPDVETPALVVMGALDHTVKVAGGLRLARELGSAPARVVVLPESQHLVGIDVERERCADEVERFIAATAAAEEGA